MSAEDLQRVHVSPEAGVEFDFTKGDMGKSPISFGAKSRTENTLARVDRQYSFRGRTRLEEVRQGTLLRTVLLPLSIPNPDALRNPDQFAIFWQAF